MKRDIKTITAIMAGAAVLGTGVYVAVPALATEPKPAGTTATPSADPQRKPLARRAWRGVHGEATVRRDGGFAETGWQRGEITAISGATLTVRSADGVTWQWTTNGDTRVRKNREKTQVSSLRVGDRVFLVGPADDAGRTARAVVVPKAK